MDRKNSGSSDHSRLAAAISGIAWIILSPLAVILAAGLDKTSSHTVYTVHLLLIGAWSAGGVICGIGTIASWPWVARLKVILLWVVIAYYGVVLVIATMFVFFGPDRVSTPTMVIAVLASALIFLRALRRKA